MDLKTIAAQMKRLDGDTVKVGVLSGAGSYDSGEAVVDVAMWMEFGTDKAPPRPFMRDTENATDSAIAQKQAQLIKRLQSGQTSHDAVAEELGKHYVRLIQNTILDGDFSALNPTTVVKKGHNRPLLDTGRLLNSIKWEKT